MKWWESVELALRNLGGGASLARLYREVRKVREEHNDTIPESLEAVIRKELEYNSSDSTNWRGDRDLFYSVHGIGMGYWGLRTSIPTAPFASDIEDPAPREGQERAEVTASRIIRDTAMTRKIKAIHRSQCQICGEWIELPDGERYVEAHHIIPLGAPHNGPDIPANIVVVCPNHHAMLDFGCMDLNLSALVMVAGHVISPVSIDYHNREIRASDKTRN